MKQPIKSHIVLVILIALLIVLLVSLWKPWDQSFVDYRVDTINTCSNGIQTDAFGQQYTVRIKKSDERAFVADSQRNQRCINKL